MVLIESILKFDEDSLDLHAYYKGLPIYYWYIGTENSMKEGLSYLFDNLNKKRHILIGEPEVYNYAASSYEDHSIYVVLYQALSNLEYLEKKYEEKKYNENLRLSR